MDAKQLEAAARFLALPRILLVEDLADALGVTVETARRWCRDGHIPASRLGRRYVISREQLLSHLEREANQGPGSDDPRRPELAILAGGGA